MNLGKMMLLVFTLSVSSAYAAGDKQGNGGGGVRRGGRYMTFHTAGLYTEPQPRTGLDLESLKALLDTVTSWPFLSASTQADLISAIQPSALRTYYAVETSRFSRATLKRLVAEFHRVTKV